MSDNPQAIRTAALLQRALDEHLEAVMTVTDTERELHRFRQGVHRRSRAGRVMAAAAAVVLTAAAIGGALALRDDGAQGLLTGSGPGDADPAAPQDLSGSLLIVTGSSTPAALPFGTQEEREGRGTGTVRLELPGRDLDGVAVVEFSASFAGEGATGPGEFSHLWGSLRLEVDSTTCRGSFGWSNFASPPEGGGSMHARCEDGATLAATMVATEQVPGPNGIAIDLRDGWYVPGSTN